MQGWIKLDRKIEENKIWFYERFSRGQAWVDLILLANHDIKTFGVRGIEVTVQRGQLAYSKLSLAKRWQWERKTVDKFLKWLEDEQMIHTKTDNVTTIITIKNYSKYQDSTHQNEHQNEHQNRTKTDTNKNDKNVKNEKNIEKEINKEKEIHRSMDYIKQLKGEELLSFISKYHMSEKQVLEVADTMLNYLLSKGKSYSDYRAAMHNWLKREKEKKPRSEVMASGAKRASPHDHY